MSFSGYYQKLCKNGHYIIVEVYDEGTSNVCDICSKSIVWSNLVDTTNDDDENHIFLEVDKEPEICKCSCGNEHNKPNEAITYKIPDENFAPNKG